jgi:MFS family permease
LTEKKPQTQQPQTQPVKKTNTKLNIALLLIAAFCSQACVYMMYGYIGIQAEYVFHAPIIIATLLPIIAAVFTIALGIFVGIGADRSGKRKEYLIVAYALTAIFTFLTYYVTSWPELVAFRLAAAAPSALTMFFFVVLFIQLLPANRRGSAVGLYMGTSVLGTTIFFFATNYWTSSASMGLFNGIKFMYLVGALLAALTVAFLLPVKVPLWKAERSLKGFGNVIKTRGVYWTGIVWGVEAAAYVTFQTVFPLALEGLFVGGAAQVGNIMGGMAIASVLGMFVGGPLADKFGPRNIMIVMGTVAGIMSLTFLISRLLWFVSPVFWVIAFFMSIAFSQPSVAATGSVGREYAGLAVNFASMLYGAGSIGAGIIGGYLLVNSWTGNLTGFLSQPGGAAKLATNWQTTVIVLAILFFVSAILAIWVPKVKKAEHGGH